MLPEEIAELKQLVQSLRLPADWDVLMVGDGSGSGWSSPLGWAVKVFDRHSERCRVFSGAISGGSTACAELYPYVHAAIWHTRPLWAALQQFEAVGYTFAFHWSRRKTFKSQCLTHGLALKCRRALAAKVGNLDTSTTDDKRTGAA